MTNYKRFKTVSDVDNWVNKVYSSQELEKLSNLNDIESPLNWYKGSGYSYMNELVRAGAYNYKETFDLPALQHLLTSFYIPENIVVYRYVDIKELLILIKNTFKKKEYLYEGFLSTTLLKNQYSMDYIKKNRIAIEIYVEKGCKGVYIPEVNLNHREFEILFPYHSKIARNSLFKYKIIL